MLYVVKAYSDIQMLTGIGMEYLTDKDGHVIAQFWNGNMTVTPMKCSKEDAEQVTCVVPETVSNIVPIRDGVLIRTYIRLC